jgi:hypothetical protein
MTIPTPDTPRPDPDRPAGSVLGQAVTEKTPGPGPVGGVLPAGGRRGRAPPPPPTLLREFLARHPEHIPGGRPLTGVGLGEEDALDPAGVRAFLAWAVREKGADPALARGVTDQLPVPPTPL